MIKNLSYPEVPDNFKNYGIRVVFFDGGESGITFLK